VNDYFQSDEPSVYAIGDVIGRVQLTPVALAEGMAVAQTLFGPSPKTVNYAAIPTAVFSQPAVGTVGLTETQAREQGIDVAIFRSTFTPLKLSLAEKKEKTLMKLVVDKATDRVLGAHMVGPDAGEIIQGIAIAIGMGATKVQFDQTIGIHPTSAEEFVTMRTPVV
jgi:glutathione reductase (NADPH)